MSNKKPVVETYPKQVQLINPKRRVRVYKNLHTDIWSVHQDRVVFHCKRIALENCRLNVAEAGRQKVIATGKKNVHASISGFLTFCVDDEGGVPIFYNPKRFTSFMTKTGPCKQAGYVRFDFNNVTPVKGWWQ